MFVPRIGLTILTLIFLKAGGFLYGRSGSRSLIHLYVLYVKELPNLKKIDRIGGTKRLCKQKRHIPRLLTAGNMPLFKALAGIYLVNRDQIACEEHNIRCTAIETETESTSEPAATGIVINTSGKH